MVEQCMRDIDFHKVQGYAETTIIASLQNAAPETIKHLMDEIAKIKTSKQMGEKEKSFALGYLILDIMGEEFLKKFFDESTREEYIRKEGTSSHGTSLIEADK